MERASQVIGQSGVFLDTLERASRAAALDRPVLVIGERGTGKELVAERLHRLSPRWDQPLVVMNCAALPEALIEAELFGHEAGAFTGATKARTGRFEEADGGTLFLDELGTLSMAAQDRLLRAVEYGEITRIGSSRPMRVDVRIVAATNEHLPDKVDAHEFSLGQATQLVGVEQGFLGGVVVKACLEQALVGGLHLGFKQGKGLVLGLGAALTLPAAGSAPAQAPAQLVKGGQQGGALIAQQLGHGSRLEGLQGVVGEGGERVAGGLDAPEMVVVPFVVHNGE